VSNPYGGPEPGEQPPYAPLGSNPYGGAPASPYGTTPYGGAPAAPPTDPVSITGFVLSLLCCTGFVGVILGIVGIVRTKDGVRRGRWAAVSAIAVGVAGTLATAGSLVFFVWFGTNTVLVDSADVGQCVDIDETSHHDATLWKKDCDEPHEAEIFVADEFDDQRLEEYDPDHDESVCLRLLRDEYETAYGTGDYRLGLVFEAEDPERGDAYLCYLERADSSDLDEPIG